MVELGLECNYVAYNYESNIPAREKILPGTKFWRVQCIENGMNNMDGNTEDRKGKLAFTMLKGNLKNKSSWYTLLGKK